MLDAAKRHEYKSEVYGYSTKGTEVRWHMPDGTIQYSEQNSLCNFDRGYSEISYEVGPQFFKNCHHLTKSLPCPSVMFPLNVDLSTADWTTAQSVDIWSPSPRFEERCYALLNTDAVPMATNEELSDALAQMLPSFNSLGGHFNLPQFIYELRDLSSLAKTANNVFDNIGNLVKQVRSVSLGKSLRTIEKLLKDGTLTDAFVLRPLISDVKKMTSRLFKLEEIIKNWNDAAEKGTIRTNHYVISEETSKETSEEIWLPSGAVGKTVWSVTRSSKKIAHLMYRPKPIDRDLVTNLFAWIGFAGFNKPLSTLWEIIPFSFMVDYIISVGDFLKQFDLPDFALNIEIVDFGHSCKYTCEGVATEWRGCKNNGTGTTVWNTQGVKIPIKSKLYRRFRCHPPIPEKDPGLHLKWKLPSLKQWVLAYFCFR